MNLQIHRPFVSPNTDSQNISVHFLILHYTSCSFERTLEIFKDSSKKTSAHFVINRDGLIYEILPCLNQKPIKAFHAGQSHFKDPSGQKWKNFNSISLGVELVNNNGNYFDYDPRQYKSLIQLTKKLQKIYPELKNPERILGHEHIAGFRGKVDPGHQFNWSQYFKETFPSYEKKSGAYPQRPSSLPKYLQERFHDLIKNLSESEKNWETLNLLLEKQCRHHIETV